MGNLITAAAEVNKAGIRFFNQNFDIMFLRGFVFRGTQTMSAYAANTAT